MNKWETWDLWNIKRQKNKGNVSMKFDKSMINRDAKGKQPWERRFKVNEIKLKMEFRTQI